MTSEVGRKRRCALSLLGIRLVTCFSLYTVSKVFEPPPESWRRTPGWPHTTWMKNILDDLSSLDLGICEARDLARKKSASLETDVFAQHTHSQWCMLLLDWTVSKILPIDSDIWYSAIPYNTNKT